MRILLDTHIIIWALTDDPRLSDDERQMISSPENIIYVSTASIWEIAIKNIKAPEKCPYNEKIIAQLCSDSGYEALEIKNEHVQTIRGLRIKSDRYSANNDPFDRILLAQAKYEGMTFLSHDVNFENFDEACINREK